MSQPDKIVQTQKTIRADIATIYWMLIRFEKKFDGIESKLDRIMTELNIQDEVKP